MLLATGPSEEAMAAAEPLEDLERSVDSGEAQAPVKPPPGHLPGADAAEDTELIGGEVGRAASFGVAFFAGFCDSI